MLRVREGLGDTKTDSQLSWLSVHREPAVVSSLMMRERFPTHQAAQPYPASSTQSGPVTEMLAASQGIPLAGRQSVCGHQREGAGYRGR